MWDREMDNLLSVRPCVCVKLVVKEAAVVAFVVIITESAMDWIICLAIMDRMKYNKFKKYTYNDEFVMIMWQVYHSKDIVLFDNK